MKRIALIVGAGAVENAWQPIIKTIKKITNFETDADGANCIFARYVYLLRFYSSIKHPKSIENLIEFNKFVNTVKNEICIELHNAEIRGEIKIRKEFKSILNKFVTSEINQSILISTNWDSVVDNEINKILQSNHPKTESDIECFHIHGSIKSADQLYLPSEMTIENYRTEKEQSRIGSDHRSLIELLEKSNCTILYGLSLDPLDVELYQTLASGWASPESKEIIIINPNHSLVAKRVKLLMDERYKINIIGYNPNDLENGTTY
jgi:sugar-specific transcriptional regulator TrmB